MPHAVNHPISDRDGLNIPEKLSEVSQQLRALFAGENKPLLSEAEEAFIKRYVHNSNNFHSIEFMVGGMPSKFEITRGVAMPSLPAMDRHCTVHPNNQEQE
ncbi:hypothetical protein EB809_20235 [Marinobacter sp. R17]|uniref:hypothetical protein n=1 Tax=Marinobacter sp. R17 TaxID=2484250 RepID=UPI000F4D243B|nr:hypothetical protein [Marinobacter sp. R17]ROT93641.1 hypothetical protein EB809_20235 [Marinobacter sp. R17]